MKLKKLNSVDINEISLYIPFKIWFEPVNNKSILCALIGCGIANGTVIHSWDAESMELQSTSNLLHPKNDMYPILKKLQDMNGEEYHAFEALTKYHPGNIADMVDEINRNSTPAAFKYALSRHFDLFDLIPNKKAIDHKLSWRFRNEYSR